MIEKMIWRGVMVVSIVLIVFLIFHQRLFVGIRHHRRGRFTQYRFWALAAMIVCFVLASRKIPRGTKIADEDIVGFDVMVMLDVSQSMLVQDIMYGGIQASRLDAAKTMLANLIEQAPGNRRGLGVFAGEAVGISPLTSDMDVFLTFLAGVDYKNLSKQGTSIGEALNVALGRFDNDEERGRVLLLLSDGGDQQESVDPLIVQQLKDAGVFVVVIGVGTEAGGPIPIPENQFGGVVYKTYQGETVISSYESASLHALVEQTDGLLVRLQDKQGSERILNRFDSIQKTAVQHSPQSQPRVLSRRFVGVGLCTLLVFVALCDTRVQKIIKNI